VILHRMWIDGTSFRWSNKERAAALRVATIFDGLALAMIDGEVGLGGEADGVSGFRFPSRV
jgi:hypothetical protein